MTVSRPTEDEALRNIRWGDIERVTITTALDFSPIDWKYVLMVKHINFRLGAFASDIVMQVDNKDIQLVIAYRLDEPEWYVVRIMETIFDKLLRREFQGLDAIPRCTPYQEIIRHRKLIEAISLKYG